MFTDLCNVHNKSLHSIGQGLQCFSLRFIFFLGTAAKCLYYTFCPSSPKVCSLYVMEIRYLLSSHRTSSFTQNRRMECHYLILFPCRFSVNNLEFNFYLHYLINFCRIYILFLFPLERMSPNIQSVQNVLTYTDRSPHWAPKMSWYSTSSSISIFALGCKSLSLMFCALGSADVKRVLSKLFLNLNNVY